MPLSASRPMIFATVVLVSGDGDRAEATIDFGSFGEKRLLLRYAPVEKL